MLENIVIYSSISENNGTSLVFMGTRLIVEMRFSTIFPVIEVWENKKVQGIAFINFLYTGFCSDIHSA